MNHVDDTVRLILGNYGFDPASVEIFINSNPDSVLNEMILHGTVMEKFKKHLTSGANYSLEADGISGEDEEQDETIDQIENEDAAQTALNKMVDRDDFMREDDLRQILEWVSNGVIYEDDAYTAIIEGNKKAVKRFLITLMENKNERKKTGEESVQGREENRVRISAP